MGKISLACGLGLLDTRRDQLFGERHDENHSIFAGSGILGYECFGSTALKSSKFDREPFHCGKCKDRVRNGRTLLSPPEPTQDCPLGLR
jgi:hypothetical protein